MSEHWRPAPGYESAYEISDRGSVRSVTRTTIRGGHAYRLRGRVLRPVKAAKGYRYVTLCGPTGRRRHAIHRLVLTAFVGPCPDGHEAMHLDGCPSNNALANLRWGTGSQNILDNVVRGTHFQARKTHCKHGHEFTPANTRIRVKASGGAQRVCRTCSSRKAAA